MPLSHFHPKRGQILICDFSRGFTPPEIVKRRPVVVISPTATHGRRLCTVIPLSTTPPDPVLRWHYQLRENPYGNKTICIWAKCDLPMTVGFDRLDRPHHKTGSGRQYLNIRLPDDEMVQITRAVKAYLGW